MARNDIKYSKLEENGTEYLGPTEHIPDAKDIAFDVAGYSADNVEDAIQEAATGGVDITDEYYESLNQQNTTSNSWRTKDGFPYTTTFAEMDEYFLDYVAELGQSDKEKNIGFRVQWRAGTSGSWTDIVDIRDGVSVDNQWQLRSGFFLINNPSDNVFQINVEYGQTDEGGTGRIRNVRIKIRRKGD